MNRLHIHLDDALGERLRAFIKDNYVNPYGKIRQVVEEALTAFLDAKETPKCPE